MRWKPWQRLSGFYRSATGYLATAVLLATGLTGHAVAGDVFRIAHPFAPETNFSKWVMEFVEFGRKSTGGSFKIFPGGQLGAATELMESVRIGAVDIALLPADVVGERAPSFRVLSLPGLFPSPDGMERVVQEGKLTGMLTENARQRGLVPLSFGWTSWSMVSRDRRVRKPQDVKGLRVRAFGKANQEFVMGAGAQPVDIRFSEVFSAMQVGIVDMVLTTRVGWGQLVELGAIRNITWAPQYSLFSMGYVLIMNAHSWDRLKHKRQQALLQAGERAGHAFRQRERLLEEAAIVNARQFGVQITELTKYDFTGWRDIAAKTSWSSFKSAVSGGNEILNIAIKAQR